MATFYVKSGAGATEFAQSTAYSLGQKIVPKRSDTAGNYLLARCAVWECTTVGTSAAAEPTWPAAITYDTTTVTSNTAVFTARKPGFSSGTTANWAFATIYMDYVNNSKLSAGDTIYVSNNHAESIGSATAFQNSTGQIQYVCVSDAAAPPTTLATTATLTTTGAFNITLAGPNAYWYGITFIVGSTDTGTRSLSGQVSVAENCSFQIASTGGSSTIGVYGFWKNCSVKFAAAGQQINVAGPLRWLGGSLLSGGTSPTSLFANGSRGIQVENVDLSNASAGVNLVAGGANSDAIVFRHCKTPTSWSGALMASTPTQSAYAEMHAMDNTGTNYVYRKKTNGGEAFSETTIVRSGGATDGTTAISHKLVASSIAKFPACSISTPEYVKWNDTTGSSVTVTVEFIHDSATALNDNEIWLEVNYFSASGSPLGAMATSAPGFMTAGSSTTSSAESWTTTGMANPNPRKLSVSFTPQQKGYAHARVYLAKASTTAYVCPKISIA